MKKPLQRARVAVLVIMIGVLWFAGSPGADAGCVRAELVVYRQNADAVTVTTRNDCPAPTLWNDWAGAGYEHHRTSPDGLPNGFSVGAWV